MRSHCFSGNIVFLSCIFFLTACVKVTTLEPAVPTRTEPVPVVLTPAATESAVSTSTGSIPLTLPTVDIDGQILVAYIRNGNVELWDSSSGQSQILTSSGDVLQAEISGDGQVIAFQRIALNEQMEWGGSSSSLWVVDANGGSPRELVSADKFRQRLHAEPDQDTGIAEMTWIPGTHRLIYSGTKGLSAANEYRKAEDVYLIDTDTLSDILLAPAGSGWRVSEPFDGRQFVPSPDRKQVAILSGTELTLVNADGSNLRQNFFTFPQTGAGDVPFVPTAIWTQDGRSLIINAPMENDPSQQGASYSVTRVPVDGSAVERIATVTEAPPVFFTFSPAGDRTGYRSIPDSGVTWKIMPLSGNVGPLVIPTEYSTNLFWSPAGDAYLLDQQFLRQLCPQAAGIPDVCGTALEAPGAITTIQWIDGSRFVGLSSEPAVLFLGGQDGSLTTIASWPPDEYARGFSLAVFP